MDDFDLVGGYDCEPVYGDIYNKLQSVYWWVHPFYIGRRASKVVARINRHPRYQAERDVVKYYLLSKNDYPEDDELRRRLNGSGGKVRSKNV